MSTIRCLTLATAALLLSGLAVPAQPAPGRHPPSPGERGTRPEHAETSGPGVLRLLPADSVTEHVIDLGGRKLAYTATAGTLALYDQSGEKLAAFFYTSYVVKPSAGAPASGRPLTFAFNGGPGAASAFLHLGLVGPKVAQFGPNGREPSAARLVDNPDTWLDFTDLVLIDPIGTGWSRAAKSDGGSAFWGVQSDATSIAKFIALFSARSQRIGSPIYLLGESYGGFRAVKVARALQHEQSLFVNGIVMLSPLLEGSFLYGGTRFALGAALQLPSLAATELERTGQFSKEALAAAEHFAMTGYLTTLAGPPPQGDVAKAFYGKVARITGLPEDVVARTRGFVRDAYAKHLVAGKVVSAYDATYAVDDPFPESDADRAPDPVLDGIARSYGSLFVAYARDELGFKTDITYQLLAGDVTHKWDWGDRRSPPSVSEDLRNLLALDPAFRVLVAHGYSDMVTPYGVSRYVIEHLPPHEGGQRAALRLYRGGHMFYTDAGARHAFSDDVRGFYRVPE